MLTQILIILSGKSGAWDKSSITTNIFENAHEDNPIATPLLINFWPKLRNEPSQIQVSPDLYLSKYDITISSCSTI